MSARRVSASGGDAEETDKTTIGLFRLPTFRPSTSATDSIFKAPGILWSRVSDPGTARPLTAGLELEIDRIKSVRDPSLHRDLLGNDVNSVDFGRQLQRMYIQFMRQDLAREYMATSNTLSGWNRVDGQESLLNTLILKPSGKLVLNEENSYGPNPANPGGPNDWPDRVGLRVNIKRGQSESTFAYDLSQLTPSFEKTYAASKLVAEERNWRLNDGVQYAYEWSVHRAPLMDPPDKPAVKPSVYTPDEFWCDELHTQIHLPGGVYTSKQAAALETIYSCVAARIGSGVPVVGMGHHLFRNASGGGGQAWHLSSVRVVPSSNLWDVLSTTQYHIGISEREGIRSDDLKELMAMRIASYVECLSNMSKIGMLHLDVTGLNLFQGTAWGSAALHGGRAIKGAGNTLIRDFKPLNVLFVRLSEDTCSIIMNVILLLDFYARDPGRSIGFLDTMASVLVTKLGQLLTTATGTDENFFKMMEEAWSMSYADARTFKEESALQPPSPLRLTPSAPPPGPPPPLSPNPDVLPPVPLALEEGEVLPPSFEQLDHRDHRHARPREDAGNGPGVPFDFLAHLRRKAPLTPKGRASAMSAVSMESTRLAKLEHSDPAAASGVSTCESSTASTFDEAEMLQDRMAAQGPRPSRDSVMLVLRTTHRLYKGVRAVAFAHKLYSVSSADKLRPVDVRNFCQDASATAKSALELAASCIKLYAPKS